MAEIMEQEKQAAETAPGAPAFSETAPAPKKKKRNEKKLVRRIVALVIVAALIAGFFWWRKQHTKQDGAGEAITETVYRGSITSVVRGSGAAVAKNSASITLLSDGQVMEVYVSEGDYVNAGDRLYSIDSEVAVDAVAKAEKKVRAAQKDLSDVTGAAREMSVRADYAGILMDTRDCPVGETVPGGTTIATLVDNTRLLLPLYFSYAYESDIFVGQSAAVSIPATMAQLNGTVHEIHKVQRVSDEGGLLFEVDIAVDNPGTLTEKMAATAALNVGGETVYAYEPGEFKWFRTKSLTTESSSISYKCAWTMLRDYMPVKAGQSVLSLVAESTEDDVADYELALDQAKEALEKAQSNLDALNGVAPIDGTVLSLGITAGEEAKSGTVAVSIADTSTMIVNTQIDEMNVSYAHAGMPVDVSLWGETQLFGVIESVSLTATAENGVARFPMVISVDNSDGALLSGAYVDYSFTASNSEDCLVVPIQCVKSAQTTDGESCKLLFVQGEGGEDAFENLTISPSDVPAGFYPVVVETGISDSYNVEILSGVDEGEIVYAGVVQNDGMGGGIGMYF